MEIEELGQGHIKQLVLLIKKVYKEDKKYMLFEEEPSDNYLVDMLSSKMEMVERGEAVDIVAVEKGSIAGECEIVLSQDSTFKVGIFLDLKHRRKGIGGELLSNALGRAKALGVDTVFAEVDAKNEGASKFFERLGFISVEEKLIKNRKCRILGKIL